MASRKRPTIADVAALAGVDRAVVSKVLNDRPGLRVRQDTRDRVHQAVQELGYRASTVARSLRTARTGALGVVLPTFANPIWPVILDAAEAEADARGYTLLAGTAPTGGQGTSRFLDLTRAGAVDGLLVAAALRDDQLADDYGAIPWLHVNRRTTDSRRHLLLDDAEGARLATRHLLALGHTAVAHLAGPMNTYSARRRFEGCHDALADADLTLTAWAESRYDLTSGRNAMHELLDTRPPPTAVMVANIAAAAGALVALNEQGVRVPEDISVIALHDIELAAALGPPLTTVRMPLEQLGRRAVQILLDTQWDEPVNEIIAGPMTIVDRGSTHEPRRPAAR